MGHSASDVEAADASGSVPPAVHVAVAASAGTLQLVASTQGGVYHVLRYANGSWQRFGNVGNEASPGTDGSPDVSLAGEG
jgi:hypothetical protein